METSCTDFRFAEQYARLFPRSKFAKEFRKLQLEKLLCTIATERDRNVGSVEIAEMLGVTPRTVRTYLRERHESISGPPTICLHNIDETGKEISVELLPLDQCAQKLGISPREIRRRIWMERRDRIAKLRAEYKQ
jgi:predicted transcriptional regulator